MNSIKRYFLAGTLSLAVALGFVAPSFAMAHGLGGMHWGIKGNAAIGTVSAVSGNTITISAKAKGGTTTTYTVNATNATVVKNGADSTVSAILVGDVVTVKGTIDGTNIVATKINDGAGKKPGMATPVIAGNGQPIVVGKITAISGNTVTITNTSNVTYSVNDTNAKVVEKNTLKALSDLAVGDTVLVQGAVNGNAITAYSITIQSHVSASTTTNTPEHPKGFAGGIMRFFMSFFGF